jgi:hypothetical protein
VLSRLSAAIANVGSQTLIQGTLRSITIFVGLKKSLNLIDDLMNLFALAYDAFELLGVIKDVLTELPRELPRYFQVDLTQPLNSIIILSVSTINQGLEIGVQFHKGIQCYLVDIHKGGKLHIFDDFVN